MLFHTDAAAPDKKRFINGFIKALELAKADGTNQVLFKISTLTSLGGIVAESLGEDFAKAFSKNRTAKFGRVEFFLETEKITSTFNQGIAFTPFAPEKLLSKVHKDERVNGAVYVPGNSSELESYKQEYADSKAL
jgi:hypothetical protein